MIIWPSTTFVFLGNTRNSPGKILQKLNSGVDRVYDEDKLRVNVFFHGLDASPNMSTTSHKWDHSPKINHQGNESSLKKSFDEIV